MARAKKKAAGAGPDVQSRRDGRHLPIDRVGVKDLLYPIQVLDRERGRQATVARVSMFVNLPHRFKGTHMSRFVELLNERCQDMSTTAIPGLLREMRRRLQARTARISVAFPFFRKKRAPVSGAEGLLYYPVTVRGEAGRRVHLEIEVEVPITALCPCSKAISKAGAHNQRGWVRVRFAPRRFVWLEEIIDLVEGCASCDIYSVLKRADEKFVTERAYRRPRFVEDVAREVARALARHPRLAAFSVEVENQESIHAHNTYAYLESRPS